MFEFLKKNSSMEERIVALEKRVTLLERQNKKLAKLASDAKKAETAAREAEDTAVKAEAPKPAKKAEKKTEKKAEKKATKLPFSEKRIRSAMEHVVEVTGWEYDYALSQFEKAYARTKCTPKEYFIYRFYDLTKEEQNQVFLADYSKKIIKNYPVSAEFYAMLYDKEKTNEFFPELMGRPWCVNTKITEDEFAARFADAKRIMYKPIAGHRGQGAEAFYVTAENVREVYQQLSLYPEGVVEGYVIQHPTMASLCPSSVNTIRVVTISSNSKAVIKGTDKMADVAYASLRVGGGNSIVDNFHSGGMCVAVDLETGKLCTHAADMEGRVFENHPVTGTRFMDFQLPFFHETLELIMKTIREKQIEGYLGWDIAITENGPVLIELNDRPGVVLLSTPYAPLKQGQKHIMSKYM